MRFSILLLPALYSFGFYGFYLFLLVTHNIGLGSNSTIVTIPYRIVYIVIAAATIYIGVLNKRFKVPTLELLLILLFWLLYLFTIAKDGFFQPIETGLPIQTHLMRSIGVTLIPMFAFFYRLDSKESFSCFIWLQLTLTLFAILFFLFTKDSLADGDYRALRYDDSIETDSLISPIGASYTLAALYSISFCSLNIGKSKFMPTLLSIFSLTIALIGIAFLGTRGAAVACAFSTIAITISKIANKPNLFNITLPIIALTAAIVAATWTPFLDTTIERAEILINQLKKPNTDIGSGRGQLYIDALNQFSSAPIFGSHIEEQQSLHYPHNNLIESFMTTGIIGGVSFSILFFAAFAKSLYLIGRQHPLSWVASLSIVSLTSTLFSGSINTPTLWFSIISILTIRLKKDRTKTNWEDQKQA